jgi:response regulator of citrate/malate metabolism
MVHVVIVEDDPMVAQVNKEYLEKSAECHIDGIFSTGKDALDYIQKTPPDLLILDVYMPTMTGLELLHKIRSLNIKSEVIMVTASMETTVVNDALKLGIIDYLIKPFTFERFQEAINKYLNKVRILNNTATIDQQVVDKLFQNNNANARNSTVLSKGLNNVTMKLILRQLQMDKTKKQTCESLSQVCNLSKVTIRRYLNYLIDTGALQSTIDYETGGRPKTLYFLK